ncbi:MAG: hypothetical protein ABR551_11065 [Gemmatimonadales bacterium]
MPLVTISPRQREAEIRRAAENEAWERAHRRGKLVVLLLCLGWNLVGMVIMGLGMADSNPERAMGLFALGPFIGYTGMGVTLLFYFIRLSERGDI